MIEIDMVKLLAIVGEQTLRLKLADEELTRLRKELADCKPTLPSTPSDAA